jgi:Zn-dependent peptidase ImmA (M78 family)
MTNLELEIKAKEQAEIFRKQHDLGNTDAIALHNLLLKLNVLTIFLPLSGNFAGMALKQEDEKFMLINANHPICKQNFSIAHELYHLFIQEDFKVQLSFQNNQDDIEKQADFFAVHLLMPKQGILELIPENEQNKEITLRTIFKISSYYGVSYQTVLNRLLNLELLSNQSYKDAEVTAKKVGVKKLASQYGSDNKLYESGNQNLIIGEYTGLATQLFEKEVISEMHYATLLADANVNLYND